MKKVNGSIVQDNEEAFLFTYSEEEKQQNDINRANAELIFNSAYLTVPMELLRLGLSGNEVLILAFVNSWLCEHPNRFYFSNKRLSKMFNLTEVGVSKILKRLTNAGYIQMSYKRKADGGQIRFINVPTYTNFNYQLKQSISSNLNKVYGSNNNISNNNINIDNTVPLESGTTDSKNSTYKTEYGQKYIDAFNRFFNSNFRLTPARVSKLKLRFKTYTADEIAQALINLSESKFHQGDNDRGWKATPDFLIRSDEQIDIWLNKGGDNR